MSLHELTGNNGAATVYLVGAGAGDADLLTMKAYRLLERADCVLYDALVSQQILDLINPRAEKIAVGKRAGQHSASQADINQLLVTKAHQNHRIVVRLKGGDPFVFGRGGEELLSLSKAGVRFEVVPGVSAANVASAYAGIPLTHRGISTSVSLVTGHCMAQGDPAQWREFAQANHTLVIYMGLQSAAHIQDSLLAAGRASSTPVAVVSNAGRAEQVRRLGRLSQLASLATEAKGHGPGLVIIGEVVGLAGQMDWRPKAELTSPHQGIIKRHHSLG
ncbi:uroporphyrinogen-III C-methyltransferase [Paraferrimonas haliotis]|uniref:uroporphyrinogen-III C-methyltransferase n=1 Tax=Paraferrimonas haliotis TaxID=2013866 RepID=A0AA37TKL0_9GAMM|nr:uroporphyrinogen-III C-methyltransferase [Paraferrimonas haliotis]GLS83182.1 uroporphyrin-III C-methyltransferase [Paraferrimonas haliotis]